MWESPCRKIMPITVVRVIQGVDFHQYTFEPFEVTGLEVAWIDVGLY